MDKTSSKFRMLVALRQRGDMTTIEIRGEVSYKSTDINLRRMLLQMQDQGYVVEKQTDVWAITDAGLEVVHQAGPAKLVRKAANDLFRRPTYDGHDLRDLSVRPGAFDYRGYPSLVGGRRVWYGPGLRPIREEVAA